ncbi:MAG: hypothetical protein ACI3YK_05825 [Eubacteriales bacterium]
MKNKMFRYFYLFSVLGVLLASFYPIYMGISVVSDMIRFGTVYAENYPKYIIPYTPIAVSLIVGVSLLPLLLKHLKKYALLGGSAISIAVFFASEFLLERMVTVTRTVTGIFTTLEDWQMYMCYLPPNSFEERTWTEVDILMGEYSPAFKLHFYIISVVLILSILNCFYGFAKMIKTHDNSRRKSLIIQSIASGAFLGMCIWACFTAFYRNGDITVSALSAVLMSVFFVLFGMTTGVYVTSFTLNKNKALSVILPCAVASMVTLIMYIGEMILLSGHLYRFGNGFFFNGIPGIVLAPIDIMIILVSGGFTAILSTIVCNKNT